MNLHRAKYLAGTAFYQRTVYQGGGKSFRVFDRHVRARSAARRLAASGLSDVQIARRMRRPTSFIIAMCGAVSAADALFMPKFNNREGAADVQVLQDQ